TARKKNVLRSAGRYLISGTARSTATMFSTWKPRDTFTTRWKLARRSPAPISKAVLNATSALTADLKNQGAEAAAAGRLNRFFAPRHVLVMAQMTLSLVLIFC